MAGCSDDPLGSADGGDRRPEGGGGPAPEATAADCDLDLDFVADGGVGRDGIPALTDPATISAERAELLDEVGPDDRVVGLVIGDLALAIPHNILWYHEIVNLKVGRAGVRLAVTYCPLTASALAFDRKAVGGDEFGVSGLLYKNNLIMYNRGEQESLWPQMLAEGRCGPDRGTPLPTYPLLEMTWDGWRSLHPDTRVVSRKTGWDRPYDTYPYSDCEELSFFYHRMPGPDARRPAKERVLGVPRGEGGGTVAFPFRALQDQGAHAAVTFDLRAGDVDGVVLWDAEWRAARAYRSEVEGDPISLRSTPEGIFDTDIGSRWRVDGRAVEGPLAGTSLEPIPGAYVAFWGAWSAFFPDTELWTGS